jgi:TPR repeat protein
VAIHYEEGIEAKKDAQQAARWYREATLKGNIEAQYRLARLISRGAKGLTPDKIAAATLLQAGADKGHAPSQNELASACRMATALMWMPKKQRNGSRRQLTRISHRQRSTWVSCMCAGRVLRVTMPWP